MFASVCYLDDTFKDPSSCKMRQSYVQLQAALQAGLQAGLQVGLQAGLQA